MENTNKIVHETPVFLSIVVPFYNEEESVERLLQALLNAAKQFNFAYEIIFVDDGSKDKTWEIIENLKKTTPQLKAIKFRRNYGQTSAMVAGFDHASGQIIVTIDGDLQNDPSDIPKLLDKMLNEGYDIVSGWRKERKDQFLRVFLSQIANKIISLTTGVKLHDYGCSLKAYRNNCIKSLHAYGEMHRFFPALASITGARVTEIPVNHYPRNFGVSKYGFDRILKVFTDIFSLNLIIRFSSMPLKGFFICTLPFLLLFVLFGVLGILAEFMEWTQGKTNFFFIASTMNVMAIMHLITLGVVGELIVNTSDLTHTQMAEITKKEIFINPQPEKENTYG